MTAVSESTPVPNAIRTEIVDVDVHERAALDELVPYLAPQWRRYITEFGWQPERLLPYAQPTAGGLDRADAKLPDGRPGGSDLGLVREQLLDLYDIDTAILTGWLNASALGAGWPEFKTERELAEQAEVSYKRMVTDQQAGAPAKNAGASVTLERA